MYVTLSEDIRKLLREVTPWIVGTRSTEEKPMPVFKDNTPAEIKEKYNKIVALTKREFGTAM